MDLFMPAERVLYDRSYYFSDEAVDDYNEYIADRDGVNVDVVSSLDFFMNEVWKEIDYAIDNDLFDEISHFDRMLRDLKCGGDPEHSTEISVVAKGTVERWDEPSRGLVVADSLLSLVQGTGGEVFGHHRDAGTQAADAEQQGDQREELQRAVVLEKDADHRDHLQPVFHGVQLRDRALGTVAVLHRDVGDAPTTVDGVYGCSVSIWKPSERTGNVFTKGLDMAR